MQTTRLPLAARLGEDPVIRSAVSAIGANAESCTAGCGPKACLRTDKQMLVSGDCVRADAGARELQNLALPKVKAR